LFRDFRKTIKGTIMRIPRKVTLANLDDEFEISRMIVHSVILRDVMEAKAEISGECLYEIIFPPMNYDYNPLRKGTCIPVSASKSPIARLDRTSRPGMDTKLLSNPWE